MESCFLGQLLLQNVIFLINYFVLSTELKLLCPKLHWQIPVSSTISSLASLKLPSISHTASAYSAKKQKSHQSLTVEPYLRIPSGCGSCLAHSQTPSSCTHHCLLKEPGRGGRVSSITCPASFSRLKMEAGASHEESSCSASKALWPHSQLFHPQVLS